MTALIDTHQHLIYPEAAGYAWTDGIPPLAKQSFTVERYHGLSKQVDIAGTIFMETGVDDADYQAESRFVHTLAETDGNNIVGLIASCRPEEDSGFSEWLDECDAMNVVGYRRILHVVDDTMSAADSFRKNVRKIGDRNRVFDMCFLHSQLAIAYDFARACDNTQMVLNHCGVPDIAGGGLDPWRENMTALADLPNVVCKLSGILTYCKPGDRTMAAISPYVDHVLSAFGPDRMVWGSDWPVVELANGLPDWLDKTQQILSKLSEDEANAIGHKNAARIYRVTA
jgi:predicted TIM-barrel fold metal-dependent hydrolase